MQKLFLNFIRKSSKLYKHQTIPFTMLIEINTADIISQRQALKKANPSIRKARFYEGLAILTNSLNMKKTSKANNIKSWRSYNHAGNIINPIMEDESLLYYRSDFGRTYSSIQASKERLKKRLFHTR
jgi:hypothetical protein